MGKLLKLLGYIDVDGFYRAFPFTVKTGCAFTGISHQWHVIKPLEDTVDTGSMTLLTTSADAIIDLYPDVHREPCL